MTMILCNCVVLTDDFTISLSAYRIYESIVNQYPEEGDPYYRMAIMLYKKLAGIELSKKKRQELIIEYLDKAKAHGNYNTRSCADNMRYWITC
jgi:hypothetical protein